MINEHKTGQVAGSAAEIYEEFFVPALFAEWPKSVLDAAAVEVGDTVLDVACGTGILAREADRQVGVNGSVVGVDINDGMLAVAKGLAPDISWKTAPAENLPFESRTFDRVVSQFGLMFFDDQKQALREMRRVLRPGGTMAVAVWGALAATPGYAEVADILADLFGSEVAQSIQVPYALGEKQKLTAIFPFPYAHRHHTDRPQQIRNSDRDEWQVPRYRWFPPKPSHSQIGGLIQVGRR